MTSHLDPHSHWWYTCVVKDLDNKHFSVMYTKMHARARTHTHTHTHTPVSYTHLDVYKRQVLYPSSAFRFFCLVKYICVVGWILLLWLPVGFWYFKLVLLCVIVVYVIVFCVFSMLSALNIVSCFVLICICSGISLFSVLCLYICKI